MKPLAHFVLIGVLSIAAVCVGPVIIWLLPSAQATAPIKPAAPTRVTFGVGRIGHSNAYRYDYVVKGHYVSCLVVESEYGTYKTSPSTSCVKVY